MTPPTDPRPYGQGDASFQTAGGEGGIQRWVEDFYEEMDTLPEAARIRAMHPSDLSTSIDKLARFLCGWLGGPKRYRERYGPISIRGVHLHLPIAEAERDAWLLCMERALARQPFPDDFKAYLLRELGKPAENVRRACAGEPRRPLE